MSYTKIARFEPFGPEGRLQRLKDFNASILETDQPVQRGHLYIDDGEHGFSAGVWDCTPFTTILRPYPFNEFMLIVEGSVTIAEPGGRETAIHAGETFIIPKGLNCQWKQTGYLRKYYAIFDGAPGQQPVNHAALQVVRPDPEGDQQDVAAPPAELLLTPAPVQYAREWFADATGQLTAGAWDTTAYHRKPIPFPRHELLHVLAGYVALTDEAGKANSFAAGDTFLVPLGTVCDWKCSEYTRMVYCAFRPKTEAERIQAG